MLDTVVRYTDKKVLDVDELRAESGDIKTSAFAIDRGEVWDFCEVRLHPCSAQELSHLLETLGKEPTLENASPPLG